MSENQSGLVVRGGIVVSGQGLRPADVYISDGKIDCLEPPDSPRSADTVIDARGKMVLPGLIDAHLHPVYADRIDALSRAAASEGLTTLIPYIGAVKAWGETKTLLEAVEDFIKEGEETSLVDFSLHCTLLQDDLADIDRTIPILIERGVTSFKAFMAYAKRGMMLQDEHLLKIMVLAGERGGLLAAHAENGNILDWLENGFQEQGLHTPEYYPKSHPNLSEAEAVFRLLSLGQTAGCPIYLPHLSAWESLDVVRLFRSWGKLELYAETCPHYMTMTDEIMPRFGTLAKMSPPLRKQRDLDAIWQALADGTIDVVASDHAGAMAEKNMPQFEQVFKAPNGIPGLENLVPLVYSTGVARGRLSWPGFVRVMSENPARIFGLYPRKGVLAKGADADLVVFDPTVTRTLGRTNKHLKVDYSIYEGLPVQGGPSLVMQRGRVLFEDGEIKAGPGTACFLEAGPRAGVAKAD